MSAPTTTWCRTCGGTGDEWAGDDVEQCTVCVGSGQHAADLTYGVIDGDGGRELYDGAQEAPAAPMTDAEAVAEVGWVAREAVRIMRGEVTDPQLLEYYVRKAALLDHIASTQTGDERRETHALAQQARAEVAARTRPATCAAEHPRTGRGCDFTADHRGLHCAGGDTWSTRGAELSAIAADLDATTTAWTAAGHPDAGPEHDAREAVFARLRAWNDRDTDAYRVVGP